MEIKIDKTELNASVAAMKARFMALGHTVRGEASKEIVTHLADDVMAESAKRSPIDEGHLIASHTRIIVSEEGEYVGYVHIPANSPAAKYAMYMHEHEYNLGPLSAAKQLGQPEVVGRKFLERALAENLGKYGRYVAVRIARFFANGK